MAYTSPFHIAPRTADVIVPGVPRVGDVRVVAPAPLPPPPSVLQPEGRAATTPRAAPWSSMAVASELVRRKVPGFVRAAATAYLARPFAAGTSRRVLLAYHNHDLAWSQFGAFLRPSAAPAVDAPTQFRAVPYGAPVPQHLADAATAVFVQAPYDVDHRELGRFLADLRRSVPHGRLVFFDWAAPTDLRFAAAVEPHVDAYVKKSALRDRASYEVPTAGHTTLCDHYAARFDLDNPAPTWAHDAAVLPRLRVGPAFAADRRLAPMFQRHARPPAGNRPIDLHARLTVSGAPWYAAMRAEAAGRVDALFGDLEVASTGTIGRRRYMRELRQSKLCFSPFGYGEICWRDVEAIAAGAVMVKPDMGHLESWPNIYRAGETYLPVRWDLSDLDEVVRGALAEPERMHRMALTAFAVVRNHLVGSDMLRLAEELAGPPAA